MTILSFLIRNPLAVIFGLFILAIITYFFFEIFAENKRIQKHYTLRNIIWGVILIVLALVSLFTPALGYIVTAVYDGRPQLQLIYFLDKTCDNSTETNTFFENTRCIVIELIAYFFYILLVIGLLMIIMGLIWLK